MSLLTGVAEPGDLSPQHLRIAEVSSVHIPPVPLRNANDVWQEIGNDVYAAMRPVAVAAPRRELRRQPSAGGQSHNTGFTTAASVVSQPHSQLSAATLTMNAALCLVVEEPLPATEPFHDANGQVMGPTNPDRPRDVPICPGMGSMVQNRDALFHSGRRLYQALPEDRKRRVQHFVSRGTLLGDRIALATACSGTDIVIDAMSQLLKAIQAETGMAAEDIRALTQPWACESDHNLRAYIMNRPEPDDPEEVNFSPRAEQVFKDQTGRVAIVCGVAHSNA